MMETITTEEKETFEGHVAEIREVLDILEGELRWKEPIASRVNNLMAQASGIAQRSQRETCHALVQASKREKEREKE